MKTGTGEYKGTGVSTLLCNLRVPGTGLRLYRTGWICCVMLLLKLSLVISY